MSPLAGAGQGRAKRWSGLRADGCTDPWRIPPEVWAGRGPTWPADPVTTHPASPKTGLLFSNCTDVIIHRTPFRSFFFNLFVWGCTGSSSQDVGFLQLWCAGMWDLPRSGIKPVSPALVGKFLTTGPPGKSPFTTVYF